MNSDEINVAPPEEAEKTEVKNIGTTLKVDQEGNLISQSSIENLREPWTSAVNELVEECKTYLGDDLHSVYIRGSVSRGTPIEGVSDIDALVLTHSNASEEDPNWKKALATKLGGKYPFCTGFDVFEKNFEEVKKGKHPITSFYIKTQSACAYGEDLSTEIPPMKPGKDTISVAWWFNQDHLDKKSALLEQQDLDKEAVKKECKVLAKHVLRLGFELVMERDQTYTRDLYPSYETFSKYYPEKQEEMREVLELAVNFSEDSVEVLEMLNGIGQWVVSEAEVQLLDPKD